MPTFTIEFSYKGGKRIFTTDCPDVAEHFLRYPECCGFHIPALLCDRTRGAIAETLRRVNVSVHAIPIYLEVPA